MVAPPSPSQTATATRGTPMPPQPGALTLFVQRLPQALWQVIVHAWFLAVFTVLASTLSPLFLLARCLAKCWAKLAGPSDPSRGTWADVAIVVVNADTPLGLDLVDHCTGLGCGLVVAAGQDSAVLHDAFDVLPAAKIVRLSAGSSVGSSGAMAASDGGRIADAISASQKPLVAILYVCDSTERVAAGSAGLTANTTLSSQSAASLCTTFDGALKLIDRLSQPLLMVGRRRAARASSSLLRPRIVFVAGHSGASSSSSVSTASVLRAGVASLFDSVEPAVRPQVGVVTVEPPSTGADVEVTASASTSALLPSGAAGASPGRNREPRVKGGTSLKARLALGDAVLTKSLDGDGRVAYSAADRVLKALHASEWVRTAVPEAMGLRRSVAQLLGLQG
jgi:hypothetical protein